MHIFTAKKEFDTLFDTVFWMGAGCKNDKTWDFMPFLWDYSAFFGRVCRSFWRSFYFNIYAFYTPQLGLKSQKNVLPICVNFCFKWLYPIEKTLILLGFYYFRATGFRQYALCRNSWYISVCMAIVAWDCCRTVCLGFPCAKTKNGQSMSNSLSNRWFWFSKALMLLLFCCFRATGNQTDALNPNFR